MRMYDIIAKKRDGGVLNKEEIDFFVHGVTNNTIPDYQTSALCMAIYLKGMSSEETAQLTAAMAHSGSVVDLSCINGVTVDKHSTGGVGDKTTLIVGPIVAACGAKVAKMSGRGLGHTGGTIDKIESIPHTSVELSRDDFLKQVNDIGLAVIGQSENLAPADKKLYALRDVTATVSCLPLIASSIMSKKIASGAECILLDVKTGSGAFMKTVDDSIELAKAMVDIGEKNNRNTVAMITDMECPLGHNVGNSLEVIECVETLMGNGPEDLTKVSLALSAKMLEQAGFGNESECYAKAKKVLYKGEALKKLRSMVKAQGGDISVIDDINLFKKAEIEYNIVSEQKGYIKDMDAEKIGICAVMLGAGRETKDSPIDLSAGLKIVKKIGDYVEVGDVLAVLYTDDLNKIDDAKSEYMQAITISREKAQYKTKLIHAVIDKNGVTKL